MNPWMIDAREAVKDIREIDDRSIELNKAIRTFLDEDKHHFVIGNKGFGKSLLLLAKRKRLSDIHMIPENDLLDVPNIKIGMLNKESESRLADDDTATFIWSLSIVTAIIKRLDLSSTIITDLTPSMKTIFDNPLRNTVSGVFESILLDITRRMFYEDLVSDYNKYLLPLARSIRKPVAVFIDNIDECFQSHIDLWYSVQNSLVRAIYDLVRINPRFRLYASIRKESFEHNVSDMVLQYRGVSIFLEYTREELKEIFRKNILQLSTDRLAIPSKRIENAVEAYIGISSLAHGMVDEDEQMCDHIFRHTLRRPRDLMEIGRAIDDCEFSERNPHDDQGRDKLKSIINHSAASIANSYIGEVVPHLSISREDIDNMARTISTNVLSRDRLKKKCMVFNEIDKCPASGCAKCAVKHVFCDLYKIGLLGYVRPHDTKKDSWLQRFMPVGHNIFEDIGMLPASQYYLLHPAMSEYIKLKNHDFRSSIVYGNIIGYDRLWNHKRSLEPMRGGKKNTKAYVNHTISTIKSMDEYDLARYTVVGSYMRYDRSVYTDLVSLYEGIKSSLIAGTKERANYLVCAPPGSGKTYLIEQIAESLKGQISFVDIDLSKHSESEVRNKLDSVGRGSKNCLCMIDEIDGAVGQEWPYEAIYKKLDINKKPDIKTSAVFVLIGSSGCDAYALKGAIELRYKAKDMIDRIPNTTQHYIHIPQLESGDVICVYLAKVIEASAKLGKNITSIDRLAVFYAAMTSNPTPRQLQILAHNAVDRVDENKSVLLYDHHFNAGDEENKKFYNDHKKAVEALGKSRIRILK